MSAKVQLTDVQLLHVCRYDGKEFKTPQTLGYYHEPSLAEYPLDLAKRYESFIPAKPSIYNELHCLRYLVKCPDSRPVDFCTNRGTLLKIMCLSSHTENSFRLVAIRFRGCIYLKFGDDPEPNVISKRQSYPFQLRQYLIVDAPGDMPKIDQPIDQGKQNYGTFSANLGKFRLLYASEITGLTNTESVGDLNDPEVLKHCSLTTMRAYPIVANWRKNFRLKTWLLQCHLANIDEIKLAAFDEKGVVKNPVVSENVAQLINEQSWSLSESMQLLHQFLLEISAAMAKVDCPYTSFIFTSKEQILIYECHEGKNQNSFLSHDYIDHVLRST